MRIARILPLCALPFFGGSCLEPTEIRVHLSTDIIGLRHVQLWIDDPATPFATLDPKRVGELGYIVLTPSEKKVDRFVLHVDGLTADTCKTGCVHATRSLSYVTHSSLDIPIQLERQCVDVQCDPGSTCFRGRCVDERVVCALTKQCDVSDDGGTTPPMMDAGTDAAPVCSEGPIAILFKAPTHHWHFDEPTGPFKDVAGMSDIQRVTGFDAVPNAATPACGLELQLGGTKLPLGTATTSGGIGVIFDLYNPNGLPVPLIVANDTALPGWKVETFASNGKWSISVGIDPLGGPSGGVAGTVFVTPDNKFHRVEISGLNTAVTIAIDGQMATLMSSVPITSGNFPLTIYGGGAGVAMDNLFIAPVP